MDGAHRLHLAAEAAAEAPSTRRVRGNVAAGHALRDRARAHAFIGASDLDELGAINTRYREAAAEQGRTIKTYTAIHSIIGDTDAEVRAEVQRYRDDPDSVAIAGLVGEYSREGAGASLRSTIVDAGEHVFFGGVTAGSPATIADHVAGVADAGLDGLLVIFTDWFGGMARFSDDVLTRLPGLIAGPEVDWAAPAPGPAPPERPEDP